MISSSISALRLNEIGINESRKSNLSYFISLLMITFVVTQSPFFIVSLLQSIHQISGKISRIIPRQKPRVRSEPSTVDAVPVRSCVLHTQKFKIYISEFYLRKIAFILMATNSAANTFLYSYRFKKVKSSLISFFESKHHNQFIPPV